MSADSTANFAHYEGELHPFSSCAQHLTYQQGQNPVPGRGENSRCILLLKHNSLNLVIVIAIPSKITRANGGDATLVAPPSPSTGLCYKSVPRLIRHT